MCHFGWYQAVRWNFLEAEMSSSVWCPQLYCAFVQYLCRGGWSIWWPWRCPTALTAVAKTGGKYCDDSWFARTRKTQSKVPPSKVKWPEMWRNSNSHCLHFLFCRLTLLYSIWYLYCVSSASLWILLYQFWFSGWSQYSGSKNESLQLNCARNSAMHSPESQMKCFAFVVASVSKRQSNMECQKLDFFIPKLVNDCPQLVLMYSVSGRSSKT